MMHGVSDLWCDIRCSRVKLVDQTSSSNSHITVSKSVDAKRNDLSSTPAAAFDWEGLTSY